MAEEHRCQAHKLCVNNCGFFGSPATQDLCSKCYRDLQLKEQQSSSAMLVLNHSLSFASPQAEPEAEAEVLPPPSSFLPEPSATVKEEAASTANRCGTCRRKVGLTGFKCRCGVTFCGSHRYPEQHACGFDFKSFGREEIRKANPLVKADKLPRI